MKFRQPGFGARIIQPDVIHCGGITELRRIASLAETYLVEISPHMWYGPVAHTASIHAIAASPVLSTLDQGKEWAAAYPSPGTGEDAGRQVRDSRHIRP